MKILLFRGRGVISVLIRFQTRARIYSHAAILFDDDTVYEAWQGKGVRKTHLKSWVGVDAYECIGITASQIAMVREFLERQIGKPYDYLAVLRFVSRRKHPDDDSKWFCSEIVVAALRWAKFFLFSPSVHPWMVDPEKIAWSPYVKPFV